MEYISILIYVGLLLPFALSFLSRFYASSDQGFVRRVNRFILTSFVLVAFTFLLASYGIRPVGAYTRLTIYVTFVIISLIYFLKVPTTWWKIGFDFVLIPSYVVVLFTVMFSSRSHQQNINDTYIVSTRVPGFLSCGESVYILKNRLWIFQEEIHLKKTCLHHVSDIQIIEFSDEKLIIDVKHDENHDGETSTRIEIENEGDW